MSIPLVVHSAALAAATLVSEDAAAIIAGALTAAGTVPAWAATGAVAAGIWLGDLGLWAAGRWSGSVATRILERRQQGGPRVAAALSRLLRRPQLAILVSRFIPGTRLPVYLAAGVAAVPFATFAAWTALAVAIWTPPLVLGSAWVSASVVPAVAGLSPIWLVAPVAAWAGWRWRRLWRDIPLRAARLARWEFWPPWLFYAPVVPWVAFLMSTRGARALAAANPGFEDGGFVGESKSDILDKLPPEWTLAHTRIDEAAVEDRLAALHRHFDRVGSRYPTILKPDVGERGAGVRLVRSDAEARRYFEEQPRRIVAQVYHPGPYEVGIFYYRLPGQATGRIFSVTDKRFPIVVGDGVATLDELIQAHPRYRLQAVTFRARHRGNLRRVPRAGEPVRLTEAGNHAQGTLFLDGSDLITPALTDRVDRIARAIGGFHIGRFDVRYRDPAGLMAGADLAIVELNGVTAEATHIYDPSRSLWSAYRTLFTQWRLVFDIGRANLGRGHRAVGLTALVRQSLRYLAAPPQPMAD